MYSATRIAEMSEKLSVEPSSLRLNLLEMHREHCPWKNGESQHNPSEGSLKGLNAWETGRRTVMRLKGREEQRPQSQQSLTQSQRESLLPGEDIIRQEEHTEASADTHRNVDPSEFHTRWKRLQARMSVKRIKK